MSGGHQVASGPWCSLPLAPQRVQSHSLHGGWDDWWDTLSPWRRLSCIPGLVCEDGTGESNAYMPLVHDRFERHFAFALINKSGYVLWWKERSLESCSKLHRIVFLSFRKMVIIRHHRRLHFVSAQIIFQVLINRIKRKVFKYSTNAGICSIFQK